MKVSNITIAFLGVLLIAACGNTSKKEESTTESSRTDLKLEAASAMDLEQKGDYTQLYTPNADCKLTPSQLAEALGYNDGQVEEQSNYQGNCWYKVTHPGNFTVNYGISLEKWGDKNIIEDEIESGLKNEMVDVSISESGDTYIKRHPVQGFLLLLNANYENPINISYNYLNTSGPKLTDSQREEQKQNTYKIANYVINHYQN
ncbi:hypothetical protein [Flagellimonas oceanensis]|uniref:hypothetical protein n=1 Tax=Flagellimonas oceanensis TaxID=2499163 RepID=UPI000F8C400D|nr:hypothetical protein [Allomuricauda oceanensis]